jgi:class 3 adenylate cyclase
MIGKDQIPEKFRDIINKQLVKFKETILSDELDKIPNVDKIPTEQSKKWLKINGVICVFVDMKNSTKFSALHHATTTGKVYSLFTGTAVRIFKELGASYIDVKGDGVFALFNSTQAHTALASAVTFKTFVKEEFTLKVSNKTNVDTGVHIGIAQSTLLVSKIGLRKSESRGDMYNEVWAGKAVNMAAKLASLSNNDQIHVSKEYYLKLKAQKALNSCECGEPKPLWTEVDLSEDDRFSFDTGYVLGSFWCKTHGASYLNEIITYDS